MTLVLEALGVSGEDLAAGSVLRPVAGLDVVVRSDVVPEPLVRPDVADRPPCSAPIRPDDLPDTRRRGVRRVSFSSLAEYDRCPRGYYLQRVLGLGRWREDGSGDSAQAKAAI